MAKQANTFSKRYTADTTLPANTCREYFLLVVEMGIISIAFGEGADGFEVGAGGWYEPSAVPTGKITVTAGAGAKYVIHSDDVDA